jgi:CHAT domain-containing protein
VGTATSTQAQDILCGSDSTPVAYLRIADLDAALPTDSATRASAITNTARTIAGGALNASNEITCDSGQGLGNDSFIFICTMRSNGWPRIALVSVNSRTLFEADGLPADLPVLEAAIAAQSGSALSSAQSQAALNAVHAKLPASALTLRSADNSNYQQLIELARQYSGDDNFAGAEAAYRSALDIETKILGPDSIAVGETLIELALQVSNQGRFDEAAGLFSRAAPIIESASNPTAQARLASYRALDAANQRNFSAAFTYARDAVAAWQAIIDATQSPGADGSGIAPPVSASLEGELAHGFRIEAEMAMRLDDMPTAEAAAENALKIISEQPELPLWWRPETVLLMGEINARQRRVVAAERDFTDALAMDRKLFGDAAPTANVLLEQGQFYADQQLYPASVASFRDAFSILAKDSVARSQIVADQIIPFLTAATGLGGTTGQGKALEEEMFSAIQLIGSSVADQAIAHVAAREAVADQNLASLIRQAQDAQREQDNLRIDVALERAKADDERDAALENKLAADLAVATGHTTALLAQVRQRFPNYSKIADPGAVELANLQARLGAHESFVSFVIGVHSSYVLLVNQEGLTVRPITATETSLAADVSDLRGAFSARLGGLPDFSLKSSYALYHQLLGPIEAQLTGVDHMVFALSGDLASLPMSLLVTVDPGDSQNYGDASWLIRRTAVSQVPSPAAFMALRNARRTAAVQPFLGVGNPLFTGNNSADGSSKALDALANLCQQGGPVDPALLRAMAPLPETAIELQTVARSLNATPDSILLGADATESALRAKPLDQYAVLYFATHALLPGELHCQSEPALVFSPPDEPVASTDADGLLTASEIAGLKLNADLVVLSACNTAAGGGVNFGGGALEGLADSFFIAGAHAVLASHWEVPSMATQQLMSGLFVNLAQDPSHDLAEALRQSQLTLIAQSSTAHPFNWAAFTLIGDSANRNGEKS